MYYLKSRTIKLILSTCCFLFLNNVNSQVKITVGASGANYTSINAALVALRTTTITQPHQILLQKNYNYKQETIPLIITNQPGASAINTITIKPDSGVVTSIKGAVDGGAVIKFNGCKYFILDGSNKVNGTTRDLTVVDTSQNVIDIHDVPSYNSNAVIWVSTPSPFSPTSNITIKNCNVEGYRNGSVLTIVTGILISGPNFFTNTNDTSESNKYGTINNISIINNQISNIRFCGIGALGLGLIKHLDSGLIIDRNIVGSATVPMSGPRFIGIAVLRYKNITMSNNEIVGMNHPSTEEETHLNFVDENTYGICNINNLNATVFNNMIHGLSTDINNSQLFGVYNSSNDYLTRAGNKSTNHRFYNNTIYDFAFTENSNSVPFVTAFYHEGGWRDKYNFNSVYLSGIFGKSASRPVTAFFYSNRFSGSAQTMLTNYDSTEIRNNIFYINDNTSNASKYLFYTNRSLHAAFYTNMSNNLYYNTANTKNFIAYINGTSYQTFGNWQTFVGTADANSKYGDPLYISTTNLNIQAGSAAILSAIPRNNINFDILYATRDAIKPTIGAYEYSYNPAIIKNAYPIILRNLDTLNIVGSKLSQIQLIGFPDSQQVSTLLTKTALNATDTLYKILIPSVLRGGLYIVKGVDNQNFQTTTYRLIRVYTFPIDSVYVKSWGFNDYGQYTRPETQRRVVHLSTGSGHRILLRLNATVQAQGLNNNNQLPLNPVDSVVEMAAGLNHTILLRTNGVVHVYGNQTNKPADSVGYVNISAGLLHSLYLKNDYSMITRGSNSNSQLNVPVTFLSARNLSGGGFHSLGIGSTQTISGWGSNASGQATLAVGSNNNIELIAGGHIHSLASKTNRVPLAFGSNSRGQATVPTLSNVNYIKAGAYFSNALQNNEIFTAWGFNGIDTLNAYPRNGALNYSNVAGLIDSFNKQPDVVAIGNSTPYIYNSVLQRLFIQTSVKNGTISPKIYFKWGDTVVITYSPLPGRVLDSIFIDSVYVGKDSLIRYTFPNATYSRYIRVVFSDTPRPVVLLNPSRLGLRLCPNETDTSKYLKVRALGNTLNNLNIKLLSYQWYRNRFKDTLNGVPLAGANGVLNSYDTTLKFYPPSNVYPDTSYYYVRFINSSFGDTFSSVSGAVITMKAAISWKINDSIFNYCVPSSDSAFIKLRYTKFYSSDTFNFKLYQTNTNTNYNGMLQSVLPFPPPVQTYKTAQFLVNTPQTRYYYIFSTNMFGCIDTTPIYTLQWTTLINITTINLKDSLYCQGALTKALVISTGLDSNKVQYRWYANNMPSFNGAIPLNVLNDSSFKPFSIPNGIIGDSTWYYVIVTDKLGVCKSDTSVLSGLIAITRPEIVNPNTLLRQYCQYMAQDTLKVTVNNLYWKNKVDYTWYKRIVSIPQSIQLVGMDSFYVPDGLNYDSAYYFAVVSSKAGTGCSLRDTSFLSGLYITYPFPTISNILRDTSFCFVPGVTSLNLTISSPWQTSLLVQWYQTNQGLQYIGNALVGDTNLYLNVNNKIDTSFYYAIVRNNYGCVDTSNIVRVINFPVPDSSSIDFILNGGMPIICVPAGDTTRVAIAIKNPQNIPLTWDIYRSFTNTYMGSVIPHFTVRPLDSFVTDTLRIFNQSTHYFYTVYSNQYGCKDSSSISKIQWYFGLELNTVNLTGNSYCRGAIANPLTVALQIPLDTSRIIYNWYGTYSPTLYNGFLLATNKDSFWVPATNPVNPIRDTMYYYTIVQDKLFECASDTSAISGVIILSYPNIDSITQVTTPAERCQNANYDSISVKLNGNWVGQVRYVWFKNKSQIFTGADSISNDSVLYPMATLVDTSYYFLVVKADAMSGCYGAADTSDIIGPFITYPYPNITGLLDTFTAVCRNTIPAIISAQYQYLWATDSLRFRWLVKPFSGSVFNIILDTIKVNSFDTWKVLADSFELQYIVSNKIGCADTSNIGRYELLRTAFQDSVKIIINDNISNLCLNLLDSQMIFLKTVNTNLTPMPPDYPMPITWKIFISDTNVFNGNQLNFNQRLLPQDTNYFDSDKFAISKSNITSTKYFYSVLTNRNGCMDTSMPFKIDWTRLLKITNINLNGALYCNGDTALPLAVSVKGYDTTRILYKWYRNNQVSILNSQLVKSSNDSFYIPLTNYKAGDSSYYFVIAEDKLNYCIADTSNISGLIYLRNATYINTFDTTDYNKCINSGSFDSLKIGIYNGWADSFNYTWYQAALTNNYVPAFYSNKKSIQPNQTIADSVYYFCILKPLTSAVCPRINDTTKYSGLYVVYPLPIINNILLDTVLCFTNSPLSYSLDINPIWMPSTQVWTWFINDSNRFNGATSLGNYAFKNINIFLKDTNIIDTNYYFAQYQNTYCQVRSNIFNIVVYPKPSHQIINFKASVIDNCVPIQDSFVKGLSFSISYLSPLPQLSTRFYVSSSAMFSGTLLTTSSKSGSGFDSVFNVAEALKVSNPQSYYFYALLENVLGCVDTTPLKNINFIDKIIATTIQLNSHIYCIGEAPVALQVSNVLGYDTTKINYSWYGNIMYDYNSANLFSVLNDSFYFPATVPSMLVKDSMFYYAVLTDKNNYCRSDTSAISGAIVINYPKIVVQPNRNNYTLCFGNPIPKISVGIDNNWKLNVDYFWYKLKDTLNLNSAVLVSNDSAFVPILNAGDTAYFYCITKGKSSSSCPNFVDTTNFSGVYIIFRTPVITNIFKDTSYCSNIDSARYQLKLAQVNIADSVKISWYVSNNNSYNGNQILGLSDSIFNTNRTIGTRYYYAVASNKYLCFDSSNIFNVIINPHPYQQGISDIINNNLGLLCLPINFATKVNVIVSNPLNASISWSLYQSTIPSKNGTILSVFPTSRVDSFVTDSIKINMPSVKYFYTIYSNNFGCFDTSDVFRIEWYDAIKITEVNFATATYCKNGLSSPLALSISNSTNRNVVVDWYGSHSSDYNNKFLVQTGFDTFFYPPTSSVAPYTDSMYYFASVRDIGFLCASDSSAISGKILIDYPMILVDPSPNLSESCQGSFAMPLSIGVSANWLYFLNYQWYKVLANNPVPILVSSDTLNVFIPDNINFDSAYYFCIISTRNSAACPNLSDTSKFSGLHIVYPKPVLNNNLLDTAFCHTNEIILSYIEVDPIWALNLNYNWYQTSNVSYNNATFLESTTNPFFNVNVLGGLQNYFVVVENEKGCKSTSNISTIEVYPSIADQDIGYSFNNNKQLLCIPFGDTTRISLEFANPNNEFYYFSVYQDTIPNYTSRLINFYPTMTSDSFISDKIYVNEPMTYYFYTVIRNSFNCVDTSPILKVQWYKSIEINTINLSTANYCKGSTPQPLVITGNGLLDTSTTIFEWYGTPFNSYYNPRRFFSGVDTFFYPSTIPNNFVLDTMYYFAVARNKKFECANDTSDISGQIILTYPQVIGNPYNINNRSYACVGQNHDTLNIVIKDGWQNNVIYNWYRNNYYSLNGALLVSQDSFYVPPSSIADTFVYFVIIEAKSGQCAGLKDTSSFTTPIITYPYPRILSVLPNIDTCISGNQKLLYIPRVENTLNEPLNYMWYINSSNSYSGGVRVLNTYSSIIDLTTLKPNTNFYLYVYIANLYGCYDSSNIGMITLRPTPFDQKLGANFNDGKSTFCLNINDTNRVKIELYNPQKVAFNWQFFENTMSNYNGMVSPVYLGNNPLDTLTWFSKNYQFNQPTKKYFYIVFQNNFNCYDTTPINETQWYSLLSIVKTNLNGASYCKNEKIVTPLFISTGIDTSKINYQWYYNTQPNYNGAMILPNARDTFIVPRTQVIDGQPDTSYYFIIATDKAYKCAADTSQISGAIAIIYPKIKSVLSLDTVKVCLNEPQATFTINIDPMWQNQVYIYWYKTLSRSYNGTLVYRNNFSYTPEGSIPDSAYFYAVVESFGLCNKATDTTNISGLQINYPIPQLVNNLTNKTICFGDVAGILRAAVYYPWGDSIKYQWFQNIANLYNNAKLIAGANNSYFLPSYTKLDSIYYYVKITNSIGCSATSNISRVIVNPTPNLLGVRAVINDSLLLLCSGLNDSNFINLKIINPNNVNVSWELFINSTNQFGGKVLNTFNTTTPYLYYTEKFATPPSTAKYFYVRFTDINNCFNYTMPNRIFFYSLTKFSNISLANYTYCRLDQPIPLVVYSTNTDSNQIQYQWYATYQNSYIPNYIIPNANNTTWIPSTNAMKPASDSTYYFIVATDKQNKCASVTSNLSGLIKVIYPKIIQILNGEAASICINDSFKTIRVDVQSNFVGSDLNYAWYKTEVPKLGTGNLVSNNSTYIPLALVADSSFYYAVVSSNTCSNARDTTPILGAFITYPYPPASTILKDTQFCENTSSSLILVNSTYNFKGNVQYTWYKTNARDTINAELIGTSSSFNLPTHLGNYFYYYKVSNDIGCSNYSNIASYKNYPNPNLEIDTQLANPVVVPGTTFKVIGRGAPILSWYPKELVLPNVSNNNDEVTFIVDKEQRFYMSGASINGCVDTVSLLVRIVDSNIDIYPSKVITPNNDGFNDYWIIHNIEFFQENDITIYNEINEIVKTFKDYHSKTKWFATTSFNTSLPNGQYYYIINLYRNGILFRVKKGTILIRSDY
ncbi:MAG: gliding motility-associated C-terminal domain-containing protein [Alphaproteobacteria bacterium]|nr:gliding motility-associated C-terminal domain-containing protein [Alphaproteobacteria bacterium]